MSKTGDIVKSKDTATVRWNSCRLVQYGAT